jgi:hypothetical protein
MTPQERQLVTDLFDRLSSLETTARDPEAERLIADGAARAPHALYALVQTVLVQDEALKRAEAHIRELEGGAEPQSGGFLDSMRSAILGGNAAASRGSVPSVAPASKWNSGQAAPGYQQNAAPQGYSQPGYGQPPVEQPSRGGSFLGTAAAAAAGVIGGSMLFNGLSSMMGGHRGQAFASPDSERGSPWGGGDDSNSNLARDAGLNDINGNSGSRGDAQPAGLFGNDDNNDDDYNDDDNDADFDSDYGDDTSDA